jgi:hypothetical protein
MAYQLWAKVTDLYVIVNSLAVNSGLISADFIEGSLSGINVPGIMESHGARGGWMNEAPHDIEQVLYRSYTRHTSDAIYCRFTFLHVALKHMKEEVAAFRMTRKVNSHESDH